MKKKPKKKSKKNKSIGLVKIANLTSKSISGVISNYKKKKSWKE